MHKSSFSREMYFLEPPPPNSLEASLSQGRSIIQWQSTPNHRFRVTWFRVLTSSATDNSSTFFTQNKFFKLSVLKPYTDYNFEVSSCTAKDNSKCGKPATLERRTDVGCECFITGNNRMKSVTVLPVVSQKISAIALRGKHNRELLFSL